jgi:hypothetical protein
VDNPCLVRSVIEDDYDAESGFGPLDVESQSDDLCTRSVLRAEEQSSWMIPDKTYGTRRTPSAATRPFASGRAHLGVARASGYLSGSDPADPCVFDADHLVGDESASRPTRIEPDGVDRTHRTSSATTLRPTACAMRQRASDVGRGAGCRLQSVIWDLVGASLSSWSGPGSQI